MTILVRPARLDDAEAIWKLLAPSVDSLTGMTALPASADEASAICSETAATTAELATGSFDPPDGTSRRILFVAEESGEGSTDGSGRSELIGVTGSTFKVAYPNLAVQVTTSGDGMGLIMQSVSAPWSRTELDSSFLSPQARGRGAGTLLSRGRFMLLQIVRRQIPATVASHLRGVFDDEGNAPFWGQFGRLFAPEWHTSTEAEAALDANPDLLAGLAGHRLELTAAVLDWLGAVNADSLPAFHLLRSEGLDPNGMYDPIDGGPTLVADLSRTATAVHRRHGRIETGELADGEGIDGLVSVAAVDRFLVTRATYAVTDTSRIMVDRSVADAIGVTDDDLVAVTPLEATP